MPTREIVDVSFANNPNAAPATRFGNLVFVSGQPGFHPDTGELGKDIREQTRNALDRVKGILEAAGTSLENVLSVNGYVTKREDRAAYNEEYVKYFPNDKPARSTVEVQLARPDMLVEVAATAGIPD
jgi:2-iminobutanoate/2-iminopropanoate deaminase